MGGFLGSVWNGISGAASNVGNSLAGIFNSPNWGLASQPQTTTPTITQPTPTPKPQTASPIISPSATPQNGGTQNQTSGGGGSQSTQPVVGTGPNGVNTVLPGGNNPTTYPVPPAPLGSGGVPNPTLPNVNYSDPSTRQNQINAIVQNQNSTAAQGSQGDPAEVDLEDQIQNEQEYIGSVTGHIVGTPEGMGLQTGQNAAFLAQEAPYLTSLTNRLAQYQANRGQNITSESNALGGAESNVPPTAVLNPAQTLVSPFSGAGIAGGGGGSSVQSLAQQVANGTMSIQQAQSMLPDAALSGQLQQAVTAIDPGFNFQQSATNAGVQGQVAPAAQNATAQIQNLGNTLNSLPGLENTSVPILNSFTRLASTLTGVGGGGATSLEAARQDAIAAVTGALEQANGMTPSNAGQLADSYFPPGLTQAQFQNGLAQFQAQIAGKEQAFSNPGNVNQNAGQGTYSLPGVAGTLQFDPATNSWVVK